MGRVSVCLWPPFTLVSHAGKRPRGRCSPGPATRASLEGSANEAADTTCSKHLAVYVSAGRKCPISQPTGQTHFRYRLLFAGAGGFLDLPLITRSIPCIDLSQMLVPPEDSCTLRTQRT